MLLNPCSPRMGQRNNNVTSIVSIGVSKYFREGYSGLFHRFMDKVLWPRRHGCNPFSAERDQVVLHPGEINTLLFNETDKTYAHTSSVSDYEFFQVFRCPRSVCINNITENPWLIVLGSKFRRSLYQRFSSRNWYHRSTWIGEGTLECNAWSFWGNFRP